MTNGAQPTEAVCEATCWLQAGVAVTSSCCFGDAAVLPFPPPALTSLPATLPTIATWAELTSSASRTRSFAGPSQPASCPSSPCGIILPVASYQHQFTLLAEATEQTCITQPPPWGLWPAPCWTCSSSCPSPCCSVPSLGARVLPSPP